MQKSKIEWTDYTVNPVKGLCPVGCSYCYARRMYKRYHWNENIRFEPEMFNELYRLDSGQRIFVGSTMELFGPWVKDYWMEQILKAVNLSPEQTFIFLTKRPENLQKWSPFPKNCWVGVSVTGPHQSGISGFGEVLRNTQASVKFISFEPLLERYTNASEWAKSFKLMGLSWLIIGQQTPVSAKTAPKVEWIREIVEAADKAKVPVFLKSNLNALLPQTEQLRSTACTSCESSDCRACGPFQLRQEFPREAL